MARTIAAALVLCLSLTISGAHVEAAGDFIWQSSGPVAPGVSHSRIVATGAGGEMAINAVTVDLAQPAISIETSTALDRAAAAETALAQGLRHSWEGHRTVATINGATFTAAAPLPPDAEQLYVANGLSVNDGELVAFSRNTSGELWPAFGFDRAGQPLIGLPTLALTLTLADSSIVPLAQVNHLRGADEAVLYTPRFGSRTLTSPGGIEIVLGGARLPITPTGRYATTVTAVRSGQGDTAIGSDSLVVSATGSAASRLAGVAVNDAVTLDVEISAEWRTVAHAVSGRELLLRDGVVDVQPVGNRTYNGAHPRTAAGVTADGRLLLVAIDGRQAHSRGATIPETAQLMRDLGARSAINLDGGGSTTMAVREPGNIDEQVVNSPSSPDRRVANALHVISSAPTGAPIGMAIVPASQRMSVGDELQLRVGAHDVAYNGVVVDPGRPSWSVTGGAASVTADGQLSARAPGDATVNVTAGGWTASATIRVVERGLEISPPELSFIVASTAGLSSMPIDVSWTASSPRATLERIDLQRRTGNGSWRKVKLGAPVASSKRLTLKFGIAYQFRVRAIDALGTRTDWAIGERMMLELIDDRSPELELSGAWSQRASSAAIGGRFVRSTTPGATVSLSSRPVPFALIGQRGRRHGAAEVIISGEKVGSVSLRNASAQERRVLYAAPDEVLPAAAMTIVVRNASVGSRTRVEIDALVLLISLD